MTSNEHPEQLASHALAVEQQTAAIERLAGEIAQLRALLEQQLKSSNEAKLPTFFTVNEVAARLKISKALIYQLVEAQSIPCSRFGAGRGTIRFSEHDIQTMVDQSKVNASGDSGQSTETEGEE